MVAKGGVTERTGEGGEDLSAPISGVASDGGQGPDGDVIAREEDTVGGEIVDAVDDTLEEEGLGVLVEVDVADLDEAEAVKGWRESVDGDRALDNLELVAGYFTGVKGERGCGAA